MKRAILLAFVSTAAVASGNYTQDARDIAAAALCGATNVTCQTGYKTGATSTAASRRVETTYRAIRAAEVPPPPPPAPPAPPPVPAPTPAPVPPPIDPAIPTTGLPMVSDGLDVNAFLQPSWGTGAIPASAAPDVVGAFRLICQAGMSNARLAEMIKYDDPIVYPGQPGKSHLHQFFGNTGANANSDYVSLRTTGESSCSNIMNRSAYWMPAMMDGRGFVVPPDYVTIYYKRRPKTDPECTKAGKACVDLPRGLRFVFGYDMLNMAGARTGGGYFNCQGTGAVQGHYPSIVDAAKNCPSGAQLGAVISAPECWNGVDLDSPDHRSHVGYMKRDVASGQMRCPSTHPYIIATFTMGAWYTTDDTLDRSGTWDGTLNSWHLSSDRPDAMPGMTMAAMKPGTSFHADWWGAWNDSILFRWHAGCINKLLNCSGADLGDGKQLKQAYADNWVKRPRVPVPPKPPV